MGYDVKESPCWPVNELGEIVVQPGVGSGRTVGYIPSSQVATDPDNNKVVFTGMQSAYYGRNICILGDSIAQQNTVPNGSGNSYLQRGPVSWMMSYLGFPWEFQPTDNFAVFGSALDVIIRDQLPAMLVSHATQKYARCFLSCGTNDTNGLAFTLDQIKANFTTLFNTLRTNGIVPVHTGIRPRGVDASNTNQKLMNLALNEWLYQQSLSGKIEFIDCTAVYADNSTAFGNCITGLMYDANLHPNSRGACLEGRTMADYYVAAGIVPQMRFATVQNDIFDRVYNPSGVAYNLANPLLQGGTTAPSGMTTSGGTWSKVVRNLANGQVRSDPSCVMAASTTHYLYDDWVASGAWAANQLQPGDIVEMRAKITIVGGVNVQGPALSFTANDGVASTITVGLFNGDPTVSIPDGNHTLWIKSPKTVIPPYSGSGDMSVYAQMKCVTNAGGSGTFTVQGFELRKVR
jgi:lysophospholipase L1-like esterase